MKFHREWRGPRHHLCISQPGVVTPVFLSHPIEIIIISDRNFMIIHDNVGY